MKDIETKNRFLELRAQGMTFHNISQELHTSKQTLINWNKELKLELSNLRTIELETLQEQYFMSKQKRIIVFGQRLKAIKEEIEKRDMSTITTEKLLDLLLKYDALLQTEKIEITLSDDSGNKNKDRYKY